MLNPHPLTVTPTSADKQVLKRKIGDDRGGGLVGGGSGLKKKNQQVRSGIRLRTSRTCTLIALQPSRIKAFIDQSIYAGARMCMHSLSPQNIRNCFSCFVSVMYVCMSRSGSVHACELHISSQLMLHACDRPILRQMMLYAACGITSAGATYK